MDRERLLNVPNLLSAARVPLAVVLFICIDLKLWFTGLLAFAIASLTDWVDGWWAREYGPLTLVGRNLDPLADKVLVCGAFIYFIRVEGAGIEPWMVAVIVSRELVVTGIRGMVEATGKRFGADWFGKLKMVLQSIAITGVLWIQWCRADNHHPIFLRILEPTQLVVLYAMLAATIGSAVQYFVKAVRIMQA